MYEGCTYEEVEAMRDLDGDPFTLMTTFKREDLIHDLGSEDAYYKMFLQPYYEFSYLWDIEPTDLDGDIQDHLVKAKNKKYLAKETYRDKVLKLMNKYREEDNYLHRQYPSSFEKRIDENGKMYIKRCYKGIGTSYLKKVANIKVRRNKLYAYPKGSGYKKTYIFWWQDC